MPIHPLQILSALDPVQAEDPLKRAGTLEALRNTMGQGLIQQQTIAANQDAAKTRQAGIAADVEVAKILQSAQFDADGNLDANTEAALVKNGSPHAQAILTNISTVSSRKSNIKRDKDLTQQATKTAEETARHNAAVEAENTAAGESLAAREYLKIQDARKAKPDTSVTALDVWMKQHPDGKIEDWVALNNPPRGAAAQGDQEIQPYVNSLSRGEITAANVPIAMRDKVLKEAQAQGVSIMSDTERAAITSLDSAMAVLEDIKKYSQKIHTSTGLTARAGGLLRSGAAMVGHDDDVSSLQSKAGSLALLIRALGEKGALAEGDVSRAIQLIPISPSMTKGEAENRLRDIEGILSKVREGKVRSATQPLVNLPKTGGQNLKNTSTDDLLKMLAK